MCRVNSRGTREPSVNRVKVAWVVEKTSSDPLKKKQKRALFCLELSVSFEIKGLSLTYQVSWKNNLRVLVKLFKRAVPPRDEFLQWGEVTSCKNFKRNQLIASYLFYKNEFGFFSIRFIASDISMYTLHCIYRFWLC